MVRKICFADQHKPTANYYYRVALPYKHLKAPLLERGIESIDRYEVGGSLYWWKYLVVQGFEQIAELRRIGARVCVDSEDHPWLVCPWWPAHVQAFFKNLYPQWEKFFANGDVFTATTRTLADKLEEKIFKRPAVLPNLVDLDDFIEPLPRKYGDCTILWCGSESHLGDLKQLSEPIRRIKEAYPHVNLVYWGNFIPTEAKGLVSSKGWTRFAFYHKELARIRPDIGLCPLADAPESGRLFNACKSAIKWYEYTMAGAATIASRAMPYENIQHNRNGLLIDTGDADEWYNAIASLVEDVDRRKDMIRDAREYVENFACWQSKKARQPWLNFFEAYA